MGFPVPTPRATNDLYNSITFFAKTYQLFRAPRIRYRFSFFAVMSLKNMQHNPGENTFCTTINLSWELKGITGYFFESSISADWSFVVKMFMRFLLNSCSSRYCFVCYTYVTVCTLYSIEKWILATNKSFCDSQADCGWIFNATQCQQHH
jgi:hypothetical protein